nr:hypothetical protein [Tanacetum cinerariifolium]
LHATCVRRLRSGWCFFLRFGDASKAFSLQFGS